MSGKLDKSTRQWSITWLVALIVLLGGIFGWEATYQALGGRGQPAQFNIDNWVLWRQRASYAGPEDLVLIGASRIQLDVDLETLEAVTGRQVYQLAMDGTSPLPILYDLALDPQFRSKVIVSIQPPYLAGVGGEDAADAVREFRKRQARTLRSPNEFTEDHLQRFAYEWFPSRSLGVRPETLFKLWQQERSIYDYITMYPTREREADYSNIDLAAAHQLRLDRQKSWFE